MDQRPHIYISAAWTAFVLVWIFAAFTAKRPTRVQAPASRLFHLALLAAAYVLLFNGRLSVGPLARRFLPESSGAAWVGAILTLAGCALAIAARLFLGGNWSGTVTIKENHKLVRRGPYAFARHPIYTGMLLATVGTAIAIGEVRSLLATGIALLAMILKLRLEEKFMTAQFGKEYLHYQQEVKALIPFVW